MLRILALLGCLLPASGLAQAPLDQVVFAEEASEKAHQLAADHSGLTKGGLKEPARQLLPLGTQDALRDWQGGQLTFTMKVDPTRQNYFTVKLWGSDVTENRLLLYCQGEQVGYRLLGDVDMLDIGTEAPLCNGRFYYTTLPLPLPLTKGHTEVQLTIRSTGRIWTYGSTWDKYQYAQTTPSRGLYRGYTHTNGDFAPPASEKQGTPGKPTVRRSPGPAVLAAVKDRVNRELSKLLTSARPLSQVQMQLLAKAYFVKWTTAYQAPKAVAQVQKGLDAHFAAYRQNPALAENDPATPNPDWFGSGIIGQVLVLLQAQLSDGFDVAIADGTGGSIPRRAAYAEFLLRCREWHRQHRRQYTNQSMIIDLYGIYYPNRGLAVLTPDQALPEATVRHYFYESVALEPWLGSEKPDGSGQARPLGDAYWQLTRKGLTKELGYVGTYGEVLDWVSEIYEATRPALGQPGDEKIKGQLERIALARLPFRYAAQDSAGHRAMRAENLVGWRDVHVPGDVTYGQRATWDGTPLQSAAITRHPVLVAAAQQMLADNQLFASVEQHMRNRSFRITAGLLPLPDEYEVLKAQPAATQQMPLTAGQPDFVFSDEEDGVVAVKNGAEFFYASLYWRARYAVNFLGRVHLVTPTHDRIATVQIDEQFEPNGNFYTRPDQTNFGFGNGGPKYPEVARQSLAGEQLPVARIPPGTDYKPGTENVYAGRASFYRLRYDHYLVGMNASKDKSYELLVPEGFSQATDLVTKKKVGSVKVLQVPPQTTVVLALP